MARHDDVLTRPEQIVLTDGGLETDLIFHRGFELPHFAACELLRSERGIRVLVDYYDEIAGIAEAAGVAFALDTATWRANPDWTSLLGYSDVEFEEVNREAVQLARNVRTRHRGTTIIAGVVGPRGDGYDPGTLRTELEAQEYHARQIGVLSTEGVDIISALTIGYPAEAIGIVRAARDAGVPVSVSFTIETDGRLPSGETLREAIETVDAATDAAATYFMINCSHPTHLPEDLFIDDTWTQRVIGFRANASALSHAELDEAEDLDDGDPLELARQFAELRGRMPQLTVVGGCCGTDARHIRAIAEALA
jgi:S-methylmethionine-dependent homocysteine/selenocysteine methylase